jgi:hypothetical protein
MAETKDRNERLAEAMARAGLNSVDLAAIAQVDPRTIDRLVADRLRTARPHSRHAIAEAVQVPVGMLWPGASKGSQMANELLAVYPSRAALPGGLVMSLLSGVTRRVDVLALAAVWLWDAVPAFGSTLAAKARAGVAVRLCLGDPAGDSVRVRGAEEGIGTLLAARCELAAKYARPIRDADPDSIRLHDTTLYASILRFDDNVLVNWHLFGAPAAESPVLHLRHASAHGLAETVAGSFERVWESAQPLIG